MSINGIINTALSGLFTNQAALNTTSANIANVNNPNYARQVVNRESIVVGGDVLGVKVSSIERIVDRFLESAAITANSGAGEFTVQREFHDRLQGLLGRPDSEGSLTARLDRAFAAIAQLSLNSTDSVARQGAITALQQFTDEVSRLSNEIQGLRKEADTQIAEEVAVANAALERIQELNPRIIRARAVGDNASGLENQRQEALDTLSEVIDIRALPQPDGSVRVITSQGFALLDNSRWELQYNASGIVGAQSVFDTIKATRLDPVSGQPTQTTRELDPNLRSGRLRGLLDLRDGDLRDLSLSLGEFASEFISEINAVHNQSIAVPPANLLVGHSTHLTNTDPPNFTGAVTFAVVDENNQLVDSYTLDFDGLLVPGDLAGLQSLVNVGLGGAGALALNNGVLSFQATDPAHGVVIADDPVNPTSRGGQGFSHFFGLNDLVAGQVPGKYATGIVGTDNHNLDPAGTTTLRVRDGNGVVVATYTLNPVGTNYDDLLTDLNGAGALGSYFNFSLNSLGELITTPQAGAGDFVLDAMNDTSNVGGTGTSLSELFGIGDRFKADGASDLSVLQHVLDNPQLLGTAKFDFTAVVGGVALSSGDGRGALDYGALETTNIAFNTAGELGARNSTLSNYAASILGNAGLMAQRVTDQERDQLALKTEIDTKRADISGVNIDEELANMVVFQNSYNAAARLITTARELLDTLLSIV